MSKFLNEPRDAVVEGLRGFARCHADEVVLNERPRFVRRRNPNRNKVGVISGGGSGHEPLHAGYVGFGMLDAAVPGEVFSSPSPDQILAAAQAVAGSPGVLFIVKNYSGDVMNFEMAAEMFDGETRRVLVEDDVAVENSTYTVGRRGVAGTLVVEKIAGAAAEQGADLETCARLAEEAIARTRTMGVALGGCRVPTADRPNLEMAPGEMELGVGIHGEPGRRRVPLQKADAIVSELLDAVLQDLGTPGDEPVLLFVNGFGGTPLMELYLLYDAACRILDERKVKICRSLVGNYVTSLEMPGASVTLTRMSDPMLTLWDAPVRTPGLRWGG
ncbi:MAG: dihydroxyacetone kinase subunit DhaK [Pseudomonadota bacterium]|jgi:dihydroxyacetone kinase, DhaK subunit|nr:MAG: dihydroxyacetone kinase subunit DhaK [Pseudomonadota bacterium]